MCRCIRSFVCGETLADRLLLQCNRFVEIGNIAQALEPTKTGLSEGTEMSSLHGMILKGAKDTQWQKLTERWSIRMPAAGAESARGVAGFPI
jgi:hypothetical protein